MKIISVSRRTFFGYLFLSFLAGVIASQAIGRYLMSSAVPYGDWASLYIEGSSSYQVNLSQLEIEDQSLTVWIREDRAAWFQTGSTGLTGKTVISKVTVNCDQHEIAVHEQRSFDGRMNLIDTRLSSGILQKPLEDMSIIAIVMVCGAPKGMEQPEIENQDGHPNSEQRPEHSGRPPMTA
jgi:hypothetical protein